MNLSSGSADLIRVSAKVPAYWHQPHLWAWAEGGENAFYSWPGGVMTKAENCYTLLAPAWVDHVIVNACNGYYKTDDIVVEGGKDVYLNIRDKENFILSYDEMEDFPGTVPPSVPEYLQKGDVIMKTNSEETCNKSINKKLLAAVAAAAALALALGLGLCFAYKKSKKHKN